MALDRTICIHGHFYQPPRENPWLETIELQDSAYPFHDWNERITAECYAPNARSRILGPDGLIQRIVSNYERISFNVGPTLLAWMEDAAPDVYEEILDADRRGAARFGGHGPAIAQAYNHPILPLSNRRDKATQIRWGIADFEHRFGRRPEGMWLPETAVDLESLELLAEEGISFTILEPGQAKAIRRIGEERWTDVSGGKIDPKRPYLVRLSKGRSINVFFYDGPVSRGVAFEGLLENGSRFARRLTGLLTDSDHPQIVNIATDGETYGHHHPKGDMALAYALQIIEDDPDVELTVYGEYLEHHPPTWEAQIHEQTSWSCAHGVGRWQTDCGCSSGMHPGWHQRWREPLRDALDWLRDEVEDPFERAAELIFEDPWRARDRYIEVILDRSPERIDAFLAEQSVRARDGSERVRALQLMELQRHALLMFTSCGWFFDELSGIETVQVIQYAGRVIQLAGQVLGMELEPAFLDRLGKAESNLPDTPDGRVVYERYVKPAEVDLDDVAAHYALTSLFVEEPENRRIYAFDVATHEHREETSGWARLALGRATVTSRVTTATGEFAYGALHFGDHNLTGGIRRTRGAASYKRMVGEVAEAFERADLPETLRRLDAFFGSSHYSLRSLFRDEQRRITGQIIGEAVEEAADQTEGLYERHGPLLRFLASIGVPIPDELRSTASVYVNHALREHLGRVDLQPEEVGSLFDEAREIGLELDKAGLAFVFSRTLEAATAHLEEEPESIERLERLAGLVGLAIRSPLQVPLTAAQNRFYRLREEVYPEVSKRTSGPARRWSARFREVGASLGVAVS